MPSRRSWLSDLLRPPGQTPRQSPDQVPPGGQRAQQPPPAALTHSRRSAVLLLLGYLAAQALLPWRALALIPLGLAAVESGRALLAFARPHRQSGRRPQPAEAPAAPGGRGSATAPAGARRRGVPNGRTLLAAGRGQSPRVAMLWTMFGMVVIGLLMTTVIVPFFFYDSMKHYQDCMLGANTGVASARCQSALEGGVEPLLGRGAR